MTQRDLNHLHSQKRGRDEVKSSGHKRQGDESMSVPNIPDQAEALDRLDHGQRTAVAELLDGADTTTSEREPLDPETAERVADHVAAARGELMQALKRLDLDRHQDGAADLHMRLGLNVNSLDDTAATLAERYAS